MRSIRVFGDVLQVASEHGEEIFPGGISLVLNPHAFIAMI